MATERKEKFTPGPWKLVEVGDKCKKLIPVKDDCSILTVKHEDDSVFGAVYIEADAHLIAAAPDMYAALEKAVSDYGNNGGPWSVPREPGTWIEMAQSALSKARGES